MLIHNCITVFNVTHFIISLCFLFLFFVVSNSENHGFLSFSLVGNFLFCNGKFLIHKQAFESDYQLTVGHQVTDWLN